MSHILSVIIPTYRNPEYLRLCLQSLKDTSNEEVQIITVIDGYVDESEEVIKSFESEHIQFLDLGRNQGMASAINLGAFNADAPLLLIVNDDNVFPVGWWKACRAKINPNDDWDLQNTVVTIDQIEPADSIFGFHRKPCGLSPSAFDMSGFNKANFEVCEDTTTDDGTIFPFIISKTNFMKVGGFDTFYTSPFWVDCDFFLKLELCELKFIRTHVTHLYHFGSRATKLGKEGAAFRASELDAASQFIYKWGYIPNIMANRAEGNTKLPPQDEINGVQFR